MNDTNAAAAQGGGMAMIIYLVVMVLMIASMWKVFSKAGQPGWASIIPIFNVYIMLKVAGKPGWWLILFFIPFVNFIMAILTLAGIATSFGKGAGYTIGLIFLPIIFWPMLGFGGAEYIGGTEAPSEA